MPRIYFYKMTADNGGAPCVENGMLSLAICKPMIRYSADMGNLIFGFAGTSLHQDNRLIYIAKVTNKITGGKYYTDDEYKSRGDCIYELNGSHFVWRKNAHHHGPEDLAHDLGEFPGYDRANVLLSGDFRYYGEYGTAEYKKLFPHIKQAIEDLGRGHRVNHTELLAKELLMLKELMWSKQKVTGKPSGSPCSTVKHGNHSCGVC